MDVIRQLRTESHLVRSKCPGENSSHCPDDGADRDYHHKNVLLIHLVNVAEALENEYSKPYEVQG